MAGATLDSTALHRVRLALVEAAMAAGTLALQAWREGTRAQAAVQHKSGGSPVTDIDLAVDSALRAGLQPQFPGWGFHSEEAPESWTGPGDTPVFVIDPIDGTRNFIEGGNEWCVVVGVLHHGTPIAGVVHVPARNQTFSAARGLGAWLGASPLPLLASPHAPCRVIGPRPMIDTLASTIPLALAPGPRIQALAHRLVLAGHGDHDLALSRPGAHDWDIVASDCILRERGGILARSDGTPARYSLTGEEHPVLLAGATALVESIVAQPIFGAKPLTAAH